jgi:Chaperone of endosialidase
MSTFTARLRIKRPDGTDPFLRQDFVDNYNLLDRYPGAFICTNATRPSDWGVGQSGLDIKETDTGYTYRWSGTDWIPAARFGAGTPGDIVSIFKGVAGQSGDLMQFRDVLDAVKTRVGPDGKIAAAGVSVGGYDVLTKGTFAAPPVAPSDVGSGVAVSQARSDHNHSNSYSALGHSHNVYGPKGDKGDTGAAGAAGATGAAGSTSYAADSANYAYTVRASSDANYRLNMGNTAIAGGVYWVLSGYTVASNSFQGQCYVARAGSVPATSSRKFKRDFQPADLDYDALLNLTPHMFQYKTDEFPWLDDVNDDGSARFGFIAEDVDQAGLHPLVAHDQEGGVFGLDYGLMGAALIPVVKELKATVLDLTARIKELEGATA